MKKRLLSMMMVATMVFGMAACGSTEDTTSTSDDVGAETGATTAAEAEVVESIIPAGEESEKLLELRENGIRVGYANDIPYEYVDENGNFTGFEIEIIRAVCAKLGITELVPTLTSWDTYSTELQQGRMDMFGCGVYITDERLEVMNFCNMTYNLKECIVVRKDSGITCVEDLQDKAVGSSGGMIYMDVTQQAADDGIFGSAVVCGQPSALALDVQTGKVDAGMMDIVMGGYLTSQDNMSDLMVLENWDNMTDGYCSYLFNINDTEFVEEFNQGLDAIKEDGTMQAILEEYGMGDSMISVEDGQVEIPER